MPGFPGLPADPLGDVDLLSTADDTFRAILAQLRAYGVHVISGPESSLPVSGQLGRAYVTTDTAPRKLRLDVGTGWLLLATQAELTAHDAAGTAAHGGIVASNDGRLTNPRAPTVHALSHAPGGSDEITQLAIAADNQPGVDVYPDAVNTWRDLYVHNSYNVNDFGRTFTRYMVGLEGAIGATLLKFGGFPGGGGPYFYRRDNGAGRNWQIALIGADSVDYSTNGFAAGSFETFSDERLKANVEPIADALSKVRRLRGVRHTWKSRPKTAEATTVPDAEKDFGFLAQEVRKVLPEVVSAPKDDEMWAVDYGRVVPVLVEAVKTLADRVDELTDRLNAIEEAPAG